MPLSRLSDIEIQRQLNALEGWSRKGEAIVKTFEFTSFPRGILWLTRVADAAEAASHHPDLDVRYTKIMATLSTHDSGGVTARDFALAREMDALARTPDSGEPEKRA
jgi:4a-hydroxytetrahydrobiopterin dehydratase